MRRGLGAPGAIAAALALLIAAAGPAAAQIRVRPDRSEFYFHGNLGAGATSVSQLGISFEVRDWDAAGTQPTTEVITVSLPAGACVTRGSFCFYDARAGTGWVLPDNDPQW